MKNLISTIFLLFCIYTVKAQTDDTAHFNKIETSKSDSEIIQQYIEYSNALKDSKPVEAIEYGIKALETAKKNKDQDKIAYSLENLATLYYDGSDYPLALEYYFNSLEIYQNLDNKERVGHIYNRIGIIFSRQANYELSLDYYTRSLEIRKELLDNKGIAGNYNNLGIIYQNQGDYEKALNYHMKCLKIKEEINDETGLAISYNNIGEVYRAQDSLDKALNFYLKSLDLNENQDRKKGISTVSMNLAQIYRSKGEYKESFEHLTRSLDIAKSINDKYNTAQAYNYLGDYYFELGNYLSAINNYQSSLQLGIDMGTPEIKKEATKGLSKCYEKTGQYQLAYINHKIFKETNDSILNYKSVERFTQQEMQHKFDQILQQKEFEEKEKELEHRAQINRQNILIYSFSIGFILLLLLTFTVIRNNRIKQKANKILQQRNVEISQQKEEIQTQHSHLEKLNKELTIQKEEITNQRNNLEKLNFELFEQKEQVEEEKKRSDMLIKNILPDAIASELVNKKRVKPHYYKNATVMFTDFYDFTSLSKELTLLDLVNELDTYFAEFDGIIEKHNIEKIKTIGDSYLCVGGIPKENSSNAFNVVLAGLEIQRFMARMNRLQKKLKFPLWQIRIGIHSGEVFTGVVGKNKFAYEVLGESVYIASRIEDFCEVGNVTISESTYTMIKDYFNCKYLKEIDLKNNQKIKIYSVEAIRNEFSIKEEGKVPNSTLFKIIKEMDKQLA